MYIRLEQMLGTFEGLVIKRALVNMPPLPKRGSIMTTQSTSTIAIKTNLKKVHSFLLNHEAINNRFCINEIRSALQDLKGLLSERGYKFEVVSTLPDISLDDLVSMSVGDVIEESGVFYSNGMFYVVCDRLISIGSLRAILSDALWWPVRFCPI